MTLTAVSLVCELTNICNDAGQWIFNNPYSDPVDYPSSTPTVGYYIAGGIDGTQSALVSLSCKLAAGKQLAGPTTTLISETLCEEKTSAGAFFRNIPVYWYNLGSICPPHYTKTGTTCTLSENVNAGPSTESDWTSKASLLNDDRFVPELISKGESVPSNVPILPPDQKKGLGLESKPTRDSNGNVTGREDTTTEIEAVDAGTTDNPGRVIIKETQTTIKYDVNNNQINTTTNTSYSSQPQPDKPQQNFEIKFDEVPPAELQTHNVQATLTGNSWGEGTCPPDIPIDISYYPMNLVIPTAPVCDTAEKINPLVLLLASIAGVYIVSGVRSTEVK